MSRFRTVSACGLVLSLLFCVGCPNSRNVRVGEYLTLDLDKDVEMKLVRIEAGKFPMGSPKTETHREDNEGPQREVTISKPFYMGVHEVTRIQFQVVMYGPAWDSNPNRPAVDITWADATAFCRKLSKKLGRKVSLPTEAQWEYACRAGSQAAYSFGDDASKLGDYAWYSGNAMDKGLPYRSPVGQKKPNAFGLYDMHGSVWEWCRDWYAADFYAKAKNVDPENTTAGGSHVLHGGSWGYLPQVCRAAYRCWFSTGFRSWDVGFRVVIEGT